MARISAEDCLVRIPNAFALCLVAATRARQIMNGQPPVVVCDNKPAVTALREIAAGKVGCNESVRAVLALHASETKALEESRTNERRGANGKSGAR